MLRRLGMKAHPVVFPLSAALIALFLLFGATQPDTTEAFFSHLQAFIVERFGWVYSAAVTVFLGFVIWLAFSRYGDVKLGKDDDEPEYNVLTWFAMLFSAGMGIGLLFYSVAEPMLHFAEPHFGEGGTPEAAGAAIRQTFFHWGLHAWAIYIVVGLSLAYASYRHDLPLTVRSALYPLLGRRIHGTLGNLVDTFAVFGTLFGVATSLGLGVMQVNAGLEHLGLADLSTETQLWLIAGITVVATISVVSGLDVGIRRLSELNVALGVLLLLFVFIAGPTAFLLSSTTQGVGSYLQNLVGMSLRTDAYTGTEWQASWTMFYWGWWISWSPFVGMFVARVSRGRTIKQFIGGVLLAPTAFGFLWLSVFGNTALHEELFGAGGISAAVQESVPVSLYVMLERLPLDTLTAGLATLVVVTYFVTSSDSGSLVIDILTSGGDPDPPVGQRIFWALTEGAVAATLLVTGGLGALQTAAITTALPFTFVMLLMCWALVRGLRAEHERAQARLARRHRVVTEPGLETDAAVAEAEE